MNKTISLVFLVVGIVLLVYGFNASNSVASNVSEAVTGTPTDRSMWLIILGVVGVVVGGIGFFAGRRS
jgi:Mn2+/Fe2+ NRAMP family transporter